MSGYGVLWLGVCLHLKGLHSHCRSLGELMRPIKIPITATQTPTNVKMASLDQIADECSTETVSCRWNNVCSIGDAMPFDENKRKNSRYEFRHAMSIAKTG